MTENERLMHTVTNLQTWMADQEVDWQRQARSAALQNFAEFVKGTMTFTEFVEIKEYVDGFSNVTFRTQYRKTLNKLMKAMEA